MTELKNTSVDRKRIRNSLLDNPFLQHGVTPVLLTYWTPEGAECFLIPAREVELAALRKVHGTVMNVSELTEEQDLAHNFVTSKISGSYEDSDGDSHPPGEWREKYMVDFDDEQDTVIDPIRLPPNTLLVQTGFFL